MHTHAEGDISSAGVLLEKGANGKYYLVAPHIEDPDEQGTYTGSYNLSIFMLWIFIHWDIIHTACTYM